TMRQVDSIDFLRLCQAVIPAVYQLIMWVCFPPFEAGKKIHHMCITLKHRHSVIATTIHPPAASIRQDVRPTPRSFAGGLVTTGHNYVPGSSAESVGRIGPESLRPKRIMVFVAVFLIRLWDNTAEPLLFFALLQHE